MAKIGGAFISLAGMATLGTGIWLLYRGIMPDVADAVIENVSKGEKMSPTVIFVRYTPKGRGETKASFSLPSVFDPNQFITGKTIKIKYDDFKPDTVGLDVNVGLIVGSVILITVGILITITGIVTALRSNKHRSNGYR